MRRWVIHPNGPDSVDTSEPGVLPPGLPSGPGPKPSREISLNLYLLWVFSLLCVPSFEHQIEHMMGRIAKTSCTVVELCVILVETERVINAGFFLFGFMLHSDKIRCISGSVLAEKFLQMEPKSCICTLCPLYISRIIPKKKKMATPLKITIS